MTDFADLRKGDHIRITLDGIIHSFASKNVMDGDTTRTVRLSVGVEDEKLWDASFTWESETADPQIEVLDRAYRPGDVALIHPNGHHPRRAIYWRTNTGDEAWADVQGYTWSPAQLLSSRTEIILKTDTPGGNA